MVLCANLYIQLHQWSFTKPASSHDFHNSCTEFLRTYPGNSSPTDDKPFSLGLHEQIKELRESVACFILFNDNSGSVHHYMNIVMPVIGANLAPIQSNPVTKVVVFSYKHIEKRKSVSKWAESSAHISTRFRLDYLESK